MFFKNYKNKFIAHNKKIFQINKKKNQKKIFLIEFNRWQGVQIANSYIVNTFPGIKDAKVVAYESYKIFNEKKISILENLKWKLGTLFKIRNFGIYSSFGVNEFIYYKEDKFLHQRADDITKSFFLKNKTKKDVENFFCNKIWIGDLIYDSYLKKYSVPTLDVNSHHFKIFFKECICTFLFWEDYFKNNKIAGVAVSHVVYLNALTLRIAVKKNIPVFHCVDTQIYRVDKKNCSFKKKFNSPSFKFRNFRKTFKALKNKSNNLKMGKSFIENIIYGKKRYFYFPDQSKIKYKLNIFKKNRKKKIVIFSHAFFDSPHVYGNCIFPDFKTWLEFLGKLSLDTDYDWYIKPHPNYIDEYRIIKNFISKYPNIKYLNPKIRNLDLVNQGLDFALTVYGSCAAELSYFGIKVVNACIYNPHADYNFSFNPKSKEELRNTIINLSKKKLNLKKKDIYEFHYMNQYYFHNRYLIDNIEKYFMTKNGRQILYTDEFLGEWISNFNIKKHKKTIEMLKNYFSKNEQYLNLKNTFNYIK